MLGSWLRWGWALIALLAALLVSTRGHAQQVSEEAKLYFSNGVELLGQAPPNYQDAYYQFKRAYEVSQSWKVLGNLGLCAIKLERDGEALAYYQKYLEQGGKDVDPDERAGIERELLLAKGNLVEVEVTSDAAELQLTVSRQGTSAPPQLYTIQGPTVLGLRAGTHAMLARAQGKELRWGVVLAPGQRVTHEFSFTPRPVEPAATEQPAPPAAAPPADTVQDSGGSPLRTVGFITAGVGGAALIGGVVTGLASKKAEKDAQALCIDDVCQESAEEKFSKAQSLATLTNILFIGGGVLAATGVTLIIVGGSSGEADQATLGISPSVGGILAHGRF